MQLHDPARQREPDAKPIAPVSVRICRLFEKRKDAFEVVGRDAATGVLYDYRRVGASARGGHDELTAGRRVLDRILQQVRHDLHKACRIGVDVQRCGVRKLKIERQPRGVDLSP